jgi:hypothetical protein
MLLSQRLGLSSRWPIAETVARFRTASGDLTAHLLHLQSLWATILDCRQTFGGKTVPGNPLVFVFARSARWRDE